MSDTVAVVMFMAVASYHCGHSYGYHVVMRAEGEKGLKSDAGFLLD